VTFEQRIGDMYAEKEKLEFDKPKRVGFRRIGQIWDFDRC
jgi:hypothetical protein